MLAGWVGFIGTSFVQGPQKRSQSKPEPEGRKAAKEVEMMDSSRRNVLQSSLWGLAGGALGLEAVNGNSVRSARADGDTQRIVLPAINRQDRFRCRWQSSKMGQANAARDKLFDLRECDMSGTSAASYDIAGAIMSDGDFSGCDFTGSTMSKAVALNAKFEGASFKNAIVDRVAFQGANLKDTVFTNAILTGTTFPDANLEGIDFTDAGMDEWGMGNLCRNPTLKGKNKFTGADSFLSAGCDMMNFGGAVDGDGKTVKAAKKKR